MTNRAALIETLALGLEEISISIPTAIQQKLIDYIELLTKWNKIHNLTAVRDPLAMVKRHLLDSLVLLPFLPSGKMADVGTGAGLPGIPLGLCKPQEKVVLIDSKKKKMAFVQQAVSTLQMTNAAIVEGRVEDYHPEEPFEWVISRAFAPLAEFVYCSKHLLAPGGKFIAMKGALDAAELATLPPIFVLEKIVPISIPAINASRHLIFVAMASQGEKNV